MHDDDADRGSDEAVGIDDRMPEIEITGEVVKPRMR